MSKEQNLKKIKRFCDTQQGFSLIELAVVLLVVGVIVGGATGMIAPYLEAKNYKTTKAKMEKIADALAIYAQAHHTLPCPAYPHKNSSVVDDTLFGNQMGATTSFTASNFVAASALNWSCASQSYGAVPFRLLGLSEQDVTDAYGNLIVYTVSSIFDQYKSNFVGGPATVNVHRDCHTEAWKKDYNARKATFCCPANVGTQLIVRNKSGQSLFQNNFGVCSLDGEWTDPVPSVPASCNYPHETETIAFVLLSRGREGLGAFLPSSGTKDVPSIPTGATERENLDDDSDFVWQEISLTKDNNYFDDIIVWRTNHQLINAFGNDSCMYP